MAVVGKILLGVLVIIIGFSGYTAYMYFTDKEFNFYGLMPVVVEKIDDEEDVETDTSEIPYIEDAIGEVDVVEVEDGESTPDSALLIRDAGRIANINTLIVGIETYYADNGLYPEKTICVDKLTDLEVYFQRNTLPSDPLGEQTFETKDGLTSITCPGGLLYQSFGDGEYLVWAKLESESEGNMAYFVTDKAEAVKGDKGVYFMHGSIGAGTSGEMIPFEAGEVVSVETPGVSRGIARSAN